MNVLRNSVLSPCKINEIEEYKSEPSNRLNFEIF